MITVIYGPQASGKTRNANSLAKKYGHRNIIDGMFPLEHSRNFEFRDDNGKTHRKIPKDVLILTNMSKSECEKYMGRWCADPYRIVSIRDALSERHGNAQ